LLGSVVLDEVDILFDDEDFSKALETINKAASIKVQYIHVTATLPVDIHDDLLERYPDCVPLMGPSLHRTAIGLQEVGLFRVLLPCRLDAPSACLCLS
jgi:ATP-dependent RNA helicase DDX18/HAS1